ncbi:hypothetical protein XI09_01645 [Bradyrhizobium sp. CCBAU 11386]|nr:hypothetical protein [Bradyrhizobium sp. CCBAU 11386]
MPGLVPGIYVLCVRGKAWMAGTSPAMTLWRLSAFLTRSSCAIARKQGREQTFLQLAPRPNLAML